jgi:hypothetical protein
MERGIPLKEVKTLHRGDAALTIEQEVPADKLPIHDVHVIDQAGRRWEMKHSDLEKVNGFLRPPFLQKPQDDAAGDRPGPAS